MIQKLSRPGIAEQQEQPNCCHHWIIDAPDNPVSDGVCRRCGEARQFKNYIETAPSGNDAHAAADNGRYPTLPSFEDLDDLDTIFSSGLGRAY